MPQLYHFVSGLQRCIRMAGLAPGLTSVTFPEPGKVVCHFSVFDGHMPVAKVTVGLDRMIKVTPKNMQMNTVRTRNPFRAAVYARKVAK